ncbi:MAG: deoxycytidylate deaminase [Alphaproteobacteria bacterium]|nr:deoxycytidylate deaminase [Alphaproteobacteria bacterium]
MNLSPYELMQKAVDIVQNSPHPTNKVAATLAGDDFYISCINVWPEPIQKIIGNKTKIGNSSGTLHAETACILQTVKTKAAKTKNAHIFVTDPPCPNCTKNIAEAGIKALYIDHKGFNKDFAQRRGHHFKHMSMKICEHAGISVYEIWRKEEKIIPIWEKPKDYTPIEENPVIIKKLTKTPELPKEDTIFASAIAYNKNKERYYIIATPHPIIGYTSKTLEPAGNKYSFILQPVNRLLMSAAKLGLQLEPDSLYSSITPTARELINLIGAELYNITIGDITRSRDKFGIQALKQLCKAKILTLNTHELS